MALHLIAECNTGGAEFSMIHTHTHTETSGSHCEHCTFGWEELRDYPIFSLIGHLFGYSYLKLHYGAHTQ